MLKKQCKDCSTEIEVPESQSFKTYCGDCYRKKKAQEDPYVQGQMDDGKLSPIELGMLLNQSVSIAISPDGTHNIEENFKMLKALLLKLKKEHQR